MCLLFTKLYSKPWICKQWLNVVLDCLNVYLKIVLLSDIELINLLLILLKRIVNFCFWYLWCLKNISILNICFRNYTFMWKYNLYFNFLSILYKWSNDYQINYKFWRIFEVNVAKKCLLYSDQFFGRGMNLIRPISFS